MVSCVRNIKKCEMCSKPFEIDELKDHIEKSQGNFEQILEAIE